MKPDKISTHIVNPEYRTNPLSTRPGGSTVTAILKDGRRLVYENIKNPEAYIRRAAEDTTVASFLVDGRPYTKNPN
jgi:hypothetical protein